MNRIRLISLCLFAQASVVVGAGFDQIEFWVGEGSQQAAVVIDWDEQPGAGSPLVWGYRWDGVATGADLLVDLVSADPRLFARMSSPGELGNALFGFGYDANADAAFAITDFTRFDSAGIATTGASDLASSVDPDDFYNEGWAFAGFWHYAIAPSESDALAGEWSSSPTGSSFRQLTDGAWDAWTFTPTYSPVAFPDAAEPAPPTGLSGDYNHDGRVDAADYTVWRDTQGVAPTVAGAGADGDLSWEIDTGDQEVWRSSYGVEHATPPTAIPEPTASLLASALLITAVGFRVSQSGR